jgi:hypothetical protein
MSSMFEKQILAGHFKDGHAPHNYINLQFLADGSNRPAGMFGNRNFIARPPLERADMVVQAEYMAKYPHKQNTFL